MLAPQTWHFWASEKNRKLIEIFRKSFFKLWLFFFSFTFNKSFVIVYELFLPTCELTCRPHVSHVMNMFILLLLDIQSDILHSENIFYLMYVICKRRMPRVPLLRCRSQVNPICKCGCVLYCIEGTHNNQIQFTYQGGLPKTIKLL